MARVFNHDVKVRRAAGGKPGEAPGAITAAPQIEAR